MEPDISLILPHLYLGNYTSSINKRLLDKCNIKHIIRIMPEQFSVKFPNISYIQVPIQDEHICSTNINVCEIIEDLCKYINYFINKNENILVHCKRGHHRSATVILAYLIKCKYWNITDAINHIKHIRPYALRRSTCVFDKLLNTCSKYHYVYKYKLVRMI